VLTSPRIGGFFFLILEIIYAISSNGRKPGCQEVLSTGIRTCGIEGSKGSEKRRLELWERKPSIPWAGRFM
jgi:hypothetical protein